MSCFWRHKWSRWEQTEGGNITQRVSSTYKIKIGTYEKQRRVCTECGKVQLRTEENY